MVRTTICACAGEIDPHACAVATSGNSGGTMFAGERLPRPGSMGGMGGAHPGGRVAGVDVQQVPHERCRVHGGMRVR